MTARPEFGDAIAVEGVRPAWLPDDVEVMAYELDGSEFTQTYPASSVLWDGQTKFALEVPRYDFVYLALERGFTPWFGGDEALGDWDGGPCLRRRGDSFRPLTGGRSPYWNNDGDAKDIIGYTRKATSTALPLAHPAASQGEEIALAQHGRRGALVERLGTVADLLCENPLPGDLGDAAYDLLRQAAAQIASDRKRLAPAAIASGREGAE